MKRLVLSALLLAASPAMAQVTLPDTPAGHAAQDWLDALNSGERVRIAAVKEKYHRDNPVDGTLSFAAQTGGLKVLRVETSSPGELVMFTQAKTSDLFFRSTFRVDAANPTAKLDVSNDNSVRRPPDLAIPRLAHGAIHAALDAKADAMVKADALSGGMLVVRQGKTAYQKLWGTADRESGAPVTLATKFRIGSMNKMFTAVAILQLADQKKLSLDDTVGKLLPDYPNAEIARKVTVRMLLTHSGGTGDFFGPEFDKNRLTLRGNEDYLKLFGARAPLFEPGTQERYSNYGFILLGAIVARIGGEDYYAYVQRHIFAPAGMTGTGSLPEDVAVPDRSKGYTKKDGRWVSNADTLPFRGMAAGGGYSTLDDLVKFGQALESGKLLPKALLADATTSHTKGNWYGYGFMVGGEGADRWYGHGGGAPGMNGELRIFPASQTVIVALSNLDPPAATNLAEFYANRMPLD